MIGGRGQRWVRVNLSQQIVDLGDGKFEGPVISMLPYFLLHIGISFRSRAIQFRFYRDQPYQAKRPKLRNDHPKFSRQWSSSRQLREKVRPRYYSHRQHAIHHTTSFTTRGHTLETSGSCQRYDETTARYATQANSPLPFLWEMTVDTVSRGRSQTMAYCGRLQQALPQLILEISVSQLESD
jgi:hypothetical protein